MKAVPIAPPSTNRPAAARPAPNVSLTIGSLALAGYSSRDSARLAGAFERELGRLLEAAPIVAHSFDAPQMQIPRFHVTRGERPEHTGRRLARAIAERLQP
jgi:hypothetical protein